MIDWLLTFLLRCVIAGLQALPLALVARLGRAGGAVAFVLDRRHRAVAVCNLAAAFPEKTVDEVHALAQENFRRIGENFACAAKTASFTAEQVRGVLELSGAEKLPRTSDGTPQSVIDRLNAEFARVSDTQRAKEIYAENVAETMKLAPAAVQQMLERDAKVWAEVVKATGAKIE